MFIFLLLNTKCEICGKGISFPEKNAHLYKVFERHFCKSNASPNNALNKKTTPLQAYRMSPVSREWHSSRRVKRQDAPLPCICKRLYLLNVVIYLSTMLVLKYIPVVIIFRIVLLIIYGVHFIDNI